MTINRSLVWCKVLFFLYYLAQSNIVPFVPVFLRDAGLSSLDIGVIFAIKPFVGTVATVFWSWVADYTGRHQVRSPSLLHFQLAACVAILSAPASSSSLRQATCRLTGLGGTWPGGGSHSPYLGDAASAVAVSMHCRLAVRRGSDWRRVHGQQRRLHYRQVLDRSACNAIEHANLESSPPAPHAVCPSHPCSRVIRWWAGCHLVAKCWHRLGRA